MQDEIMSKVEEFAKFIENTSNGHLYIRAELTSNGFLIRFVRKQEQKTNSVVTITKLVSFLEFSILDLDGLKEKIKRAMRDLELACATVRQNTIQE